MRKSPGDAINAGSIFALLFLSVSEIELFTGGREMIEIAGRDVWLAVILGGLLTYPFLYLLFILARRFPRETFFEYAPRLWSKWPARIIVLLFGVYAIIWLVRMLWMTTAFNAEFFLPQTPHVVVALLFMLGVIWLVRGGLVPLVRFFELMLPFFLLPYIWVIILSLSEMRISYFQPVLANGLMPVIKGALHYCLMIQGLEILLFALPFTLNPLRSRLAAFSGLTLLHLSSLLQGVTILGNLGREGTGHFIFPGTEVLSSLHLPGWPVERFELFLTLPWLIATFTSLGIALYLAAFACQILLPVKKPALVYWGFGLAAIALIYLFPNILWIHLLQKYERVLTLLVIYLIPPASFLLFLVRKPEEGAKQW